MCFHASIERMRWCGLLATASCCSASGVFCARYTEYTSGPPNPHILCFCAVHRVHLPGPRVLCFCAVHRVPLPPTQPVCFVLARYTVFPSRPAFFLFLLVTQSSPLAQ